MNFQIIEKDGKPEWAVIPYKEFEKIQALLEDAEDIKDIEENLKAIQEGIEKTIPWPSGPRSPCRNFLLSR